MKQHKMFKVLPLILALLIAVQAGRPSGGRCYHDIEWPIARAAGSHAVMPAPADIEWPVARAAGCFGASPAPADIEWPIA